MPRLIGNPKTPENGNGYPIIGTFRLLKDSKVKQITDTLKKWEGFGTVEKIPKDARVPSVTFHMESTGSLGSKLIEWKHGTILAFIGEIKLDDYWTKRTGKETYRIEAWWIHDQHDYAAAERESAASADFNAENGGDYGGYDPGF